MDGLWGLTNHHGVPAPAVEERPGRYIGYFENAFSEQLVFMHDAGDPHATLLLGDLDWSPTWGR